MQKPETLSYEERFKDALVSFTPFVLRSTGIIQAQTSLKVDTYSLACVPYQISMKRVVLVGSFTKDEIVFFQRFRNALAGLTFAIQRPNAREVEKIFCRCQISAVGMMKGRDQVGLVVCDFRPMPPDLANAIGDHLVFMERLKVEWNDYRDRIVNVSPDSSRKLGFNNYAVMAMGGGQHKLALFSIAVNRLDFLMPMRSPDVVAGTEAGFTLYFQRYRFSVKGKVESATRLPTGIQRVKATLEFSPEFTDIMSEYFFAERIAAKKAATGQDPRPAAQ